MQIHMKGDDFRSAIKEYVSDLRKAKKNIDVSHLPAPGKLSTEQAISFNQALSYAEASVALLDKAGEILSHVIGESKGRKSK